MLSSYIMSRDLESIQKMTLSENFERNTGDYMTEEVSCKAFSDSINCVRDRVEKQRCVRESLSSGT